MSDTSISQTDADRLRIRRAVLAITQSEVSARTGGLIAQSKISLYEKGLPVVENHRKPLAKALLTTEQELFE